MARPLRIAFPGAVYHVTSRGNARQAIVADDQDRAAFLTLLAHVIDRFGWRCRKLPRQGDSFTGELLASS